MSIVYYLFVCLSYLNLLNMCPLVQAFAHFTIEVLFSFSNFNPLSVLVLETLSLFFFFRATPMAYGGSQTRGLMGAAAAGLHHSHSNMGSEPRLRPIPQLTTTPDP